MSRILVAGASGKVGSRLATLLEGRQHSVVRASLSTGVDTVSGSGLDEAMQGVNVVVDVTNMSSPDPDAVRRFFETSAGNLIAAGRGAGVMRHILLSVVGADRMSESGYMRGKVAQERRVADGGIPFTILRATQFFEFVAGFADVFARDGGAVVPDARMQPIAIDDVAAALVEVIGRSPANAVREVGGPEAMTIREAVSRILVARGDRRVVTDSPDVRYFGAALDRDTLVPAASAMRGRTSLEAWLSRMG